MKKGYQNIRESGGRLSGHPVIRGQVIREPGYQVFLMP